MLHNKYYHILKHFLGDYTRTIYGRELLETVPLSQKGIALALKELANMHILQPEKRGRQVLYTLNIQLDHIKDVLTMIELQRKAIFLEKHLDINELVREDDDRIVGIFGSYARGDQRSGSDVDIFVVGSRKGKNYKEEGKVWDLDVHLLDFSQQDMKRGLEEMNPLWRNIIKDHILIHGTERFIRSVWRHHYGLHKVVF